MHPKMCIGESLSFYDDGILLPLYRGKGGICYVSKPEEVWHALVLRPCGVALRVALFGKGTGGSNPSVPYFFPRQVLGLSFCGDTSEILSVYHKALHR